MEERGGVVQPPTHNAVLTKPCSPSGDSVFWFSSSVQKHDSAIVNRRCQVGWPTRHDKEEGANPENVLGGSRISMHVELALLTSSTGVRLMRDFRPTPEAKKETMAARGSDHSNAVQ